MLPTHKQGLYLLEQCRISVKDDRLSYATAEKDWYRYFAIPVANTTVVLLGNGTSITQAAARKMADHNIILGFTGGGGTPLLMASQVGSEYRPTEYCQKWVTLWLSDDNRLEMAKLFQERRIDFVNKTYTSLPFMKGALDTVDMAGKTYQSGIHGALSIPELLGYEANYAKTLYRTVSQSLGKMDFKRASAQKDPNDPFNSFIDHGNYLAYGLAASALWVLGIPFAFPVMHGKTRRGALVFDVADMIKDAIILPTAMEMAATGMDDQTARGQCIKRLNRTQSLAYMINSIKYVIDRMIHLTNNSERDQI